VKASIDKTWDSAFVLAQEDLKQIGLIYSSHNIEPSIQVECFSGLSLKPDGFEQLLDLSNSGMTSIKSIRFGSPYSSSIDLTVVFDCNSYRTMSLSASGDQHEVVAVAARVSDVVGSCSQWYGQLARDYTAAKFVTVFVTLMSGMLSIAFHHLFAGIGFVLVSALGLFNPTKMFAWMCPLGLFEIGKGSQDISNYARRRAQFGFSGLALALVIGLFVSYLAHKLGW
jgi:hypothetical protein